MAGIDNDRAWEVSKGKKNMKKKLELKTNKKESNQFQTIP